MKTINLSLATAAFAFALSNCAAPTGPNTQRGAATGALLGAGAGGMIGNQSGTPPKERHRRADGGTAGALYGNARDQEQCGHKDPV